MEFSELGFQGLDITRFEIWQITLDLILKRPFIGYGASTFSLVFLIKPQIKLMKKTYLTFICLV